MHLMQLSQKTESLQTSNEKTFANRDIDVDGLVVTTDQFNRTQSPVFEQQKDLYSKVKRKYQSKCLASQARMRVLHGSTVRLNNSSTMAATGKEEKPLLIQESSVQKMMPFGGTLQREHNMMLRQTSGDKLISSMQTSQNKLNAFLDMMVKAHSKTKFGS